MLRSHTRSAVAFLVLAAGVAGCGSAASAPPAAGTGQTPAPGQPAASAGASVAPVAAAATVNACALITEKEATALLGSDPGVGTDTGDAATPACAYGASLTIVVDLTGGKARFDSDTASLQGSATGHILSGVGDAGAVTLVANTVAAMEILKGSSVLTVNVQGDPTLQNITLAALTALGTTAVGRL